MKNRRQRTKGVLIVGTLLSFALVFSGIAPRDSDALQFTLDQEFSGSGATATGYPVVTIADSGVNQVTLTIQNNFTTSVEKVTEVSLNSNVLPLTFTFVSGDAATSIDQGSNCCKADGDGFFDIQLNYSPSGNIFTNSDQSVYTISGTGLTAASFNFVSFCGQGCGNGGWAGAAHIQALGTNAQGSGWFGASVPEPSTLLLLGAGLTGLGIWRRKTSQL
jgi:hypothetical protein